METQFIKLNMTPTGVNPCFHVSQYDIGRSLGFIVYNGSEVVDLDSYTCTIEATRSDGVAITASVATDDNVGTFEVTPTMSNKADKYRCQLVIVDANSKRIASLPFDMDVCKAAMDENAESIEEDASLYQQYTEAVQGAIAEANADIQAEENARIAAVNAEATARANADATLQNNIDAEATARQEADNTLQGNINSEASTRATQDGLLQTQIDQIIAPSGEAPSAAEVQNARIGADGTVYDTLGNAIRGQVTDLKSALANATDASYLMTNDGYLSQYNGNVVSSSAWFVSDFIKINKNFGIDIRLKASSASAAALCFYKEDKSWTGNKIDGPVTKISIGPSDIPANAYYVRFCSKEQNVTFSNEPIEYLTEELKTAKNEATEALDKVTNTVGVEGLFVTSGYLSLYDGSVISSDAFYCTDFISIFRNSISLLGAVCSSGANAIAFYNDNKDYISGIAGVGVNHDYAVAENSIPQKTKYIRLCTSTATKESAVIDLGSLFDLRNEVLNNLYNYPTVKALILGDSYSALTGAKKWMDYMLYCLPKGSSYVSLAVGNAKIRDVYADRSQYPYTSRPVASDTSGNKNTLACQIEKLKRLMTGTDLDEGEEQIYTSADEYPNVIIIEGGMNDWPDTQAAVGTYYDQLDKLVENVYKKSNPDDTATIGNVGIKTPIEEVDRTCFAGAYRYLMEELLSLFPNAQIYFTTVSPISYRGSRVSEGRTVVAEQQRKCSDIMGASVIDWHRDGQINSIVNYAHGSGTEEDPYLIAYQTGTYVDTNDQLHPNSRGYRKYGRLAALKILQTLIYDL